MNDVSSVYMENTGENQRVIHFNDSIINLRRLDPHGFWFVQFGTGVVPDRLSGAYTNSGTAYEAVKNYLENAPKRK